MILPQRLQARGWRKADGRKIAEVYCAACHHIAVLTPEALLRLGLRPAAKVLDLKGRLRCRGWEDAKARSHAMAS